MRNLILVFEIHKDLPLPVGDSEFRGAARRENPDNLEFFVDIFLS
ncbi:MAG TPA: hypothetical protein VK569_07480 [Bacteroidota bacterium]|nr:hypothetical protein [Bacteroidota bacterium]